MLTLKMYSVRDAKAEAYLQPFYVTKEGEAVRGFKECIQDTSHKFHNFPEDYALFEIGSFNQETGTLESLPQPRQVLQAIAVRAAEIDFQAEIEKFREGA